MTLSAADATASQQEDQNAIQYAITNKGWQDTFPTCEEFVQNANKSALAFTEFDARVCQLVATPLARATLHQLSQDMPGRDEIAEVLEQCLFAIGMGALVSAD